EQLRIAREGAAAKVTLIEALGAETLVHLRLGADRLILRDGHASRLRIGDSIQIDADPQAVMFFDAAGQTMSRPAQATLRVVE
uniref:TOBE domain-containing protein n=1 Tax=Roseicyclus sp. TaxID=1914329 RepID=UPI003F6BD51D